MPRHPRRSCALVSGGVESAALIDRLLARGDEVHPVYVRSGYRWEPAELRHLRRLLRAMRSPRLQPLAVLRAPAKELAGAAHWGFSGRAVPGARSADASVYLPGRNLLLISCAAVLCARREIDAIALGTLRGNPFPDASPGFFSALAKTLAAGLKRRIRLETPFRALTKAQVMRGAAALPWALTFSCISPRAGAPCERCNKCAERRRALR